jgi:mono/diheme cytochrome c family protein
VRRGQVAALVAVVSVVALSAAQAEEADLVERGRAVLQAAGGCTCHTDFEGGGEELAGGRPLATPFGTWYSTNITPDPETGIGRWSDVDFARAMREGRSPDGGAYFPVFPYPSFTGMSDEDLRALEAYLLSLPPVRRKNRPPDAWPPFSWRIAAAAWQWLHFEPRRFAPDPARDARWNRGAYLVEAVAHCGECHTPRTRTGALDRRRWLAGSLEGPEGELAPNITPDAETGIGDWTRTDLVFFLKEGIHPDGDSTEGLMKEVVLHGYRHVAASDLEAIAAYLASVPPIRHELVRPEEEER